MAYEKKDGSGALFKNDRKEKESHPDYKGDILINGTEYWLSAWIKEGKSGKFMSLSAQPKDAKPAAKPTQKKAEPAPFLDDDDIGF